jgi:hypothetical protein
MSEIVPEFFAQSKFELFTRQLNRWVLSFERFVTRYHLTQVDYYDGIVFF